MRLVEKILRLIRTVPHGRGPSHLPQALMPRTSNVTHNHPRKALSNGRTPPASATTLIPARCIFPMPTDPEEKLGVLWARCHCQTERKPLSRNLLRRYQHQTSPKALSECLRTIIRHSPVRTIGRDPQMLVNSNSGLHRLCPLP
jgi:hypothetical protein